MSETTAHHEGDEPTCTACGAKCWVAATRYKLGETGPCWGEIGVSEDYPGVYVHFCEGHGHPEDPGEYRPQPVETVRLQREEPE